MFAAPMFLLLLLFVTRALASSVIYDGRAPLSMPNSDLDTSTGPFFTDVKGSENATHYSKLLGLSVPPTPLWNKAHLLPTEQTISITIDNSSVFVPGSGGPQFGFRRTEFIAQKDANHTALDGLMEVGTSIFHFSIQADLHRLLNFTHEYQIVFIEPSDGTHVFGIQLGSPFTDPTGTLPAPNAHSFKVLDHALNVLFTAPFLSNVWHNFAIRVDWNNQTLQTFYSKDADSLKAVTEVEPNLTTPSGSAGQGDFHWGVLKLPLVNPTDPPADQGDVVHFGIQEGTTEGLLYSGVFVTLD